MCNFITILKNWKKPKTISSLCTQGEKQQGCEWCQGALVPKVEQTQGKQPLLGRDGPVGHTTRFASIHELGASANSECLHALDHVVLTEPGLTVLPGRAEPVHACSSHKATHTRLEPAFCRRANFQILPSPGGVTALATKSSWKDQSPGL